MPNKIILFLLLLIVSTFKLSAQNQNTAISIIGEAKANVLPDVVVVNFEITSSDKQESIALKKLNEFVDKTLSKILSVGFQKDDLKIINYSLSEQFDYSNNYKKLGYMGTQEIALRFKYDKEKLGNLFSAFSLDKLENVTINCSYELSDELELSTRQNLVRDAMVNAKFFAEKIANTSQLKIAGVENVEYPFTENVYNRGANDYKFDTSRPGGNSFTSIEVKEIEMRERVKVKYVAH